ncbi:hypothetical protein HZA44_03130 [Candidatus Peregrinibacteria bacterium]|nr:hypothetical protein [Candidatus Peregrinibacteria bacterium]
MMFGNFASTGSFGMMHAFGGFLGIAFLIGLVFFLAWAIMTLKKDQLLHWAILLVAIAAIGWIMGASLFGFRGYGPSFQRGPGMMWGSYDYDNR